MDFRKLVAKCILSFKEPFTYSELIKKIGQDVDLSKDGNYSSVLTAIQEIFEATSIKVVPFSSPIEYFVEWRLL